MPDLRQILLAGIVFVVPVWLMVKQREDLLVKWICLTVAVDIFDAQLIVNLPAARVAGLLLLPSSLALLPAVRGTMAGRALWRYMVFLGCMGIVFGLIFPWSSAGFDRLPTQLSQVRAVIYFFRKTADFSLIIFLARYIWKTKRPDRLVEWFVYGSSVASVGGIIQWVTGIDMFALFTGMPIVVEDRMRGFNYEPRGLGLIAGQGLILAILLYARSKIGRRLAIILLHILALFLAISTSSIFVVGMGLLALVFFDLKSRSILVKPRALVAVACAVVAFFSLGSSFVDTWYSNVELRLSSDKAGSASVSSLEDFALSQDIFDSAAIMFFANQPARLLTGVGPGLSGLATTDSLPSAELFDWVQEQGAGLNTVPQIGLLREVCDVGLVGFFLGVVFVFASGRALSDLSMGGRSDAENWQVARAAFWVATAIYLVQASPLSASLSLFLAIGLVAACRAPIRRPVVRAAFSRTRNSSILNGRTTGGELTTS